MKTNIHFNPVCMGLLGLLFATLFIPAAAQSSYTMRGKVTDENGEPMAYANIAVRDASDSSLVSGTITGVEGTFVFRHRMPGRFLISASFVGYKSGAATIEAAEEEEVDAGTIVLTPMLTALDEVVIREHRLKARQQVDRTTFFVNSRMSSASQTGTDLMGLVPGVQVDLFNKISLEGSTQVIILVNGVARDADFLSQMDAGRIDRVEVHSNGGIRYGAEVDGVINVILKEEDLNGMNGHVYANIPTQTDEVFSFPSASMNYSLEKTTLYASYNGGFSYFNVEGTRYSTVFKGDRPEYIIRKDRLGQENWSHKLHFGMDHFRDTSNQISLYGFISGFSNEQDGRVAISGPRISAAPIEQTMFKDDTDRNRSAYGSAFYKHRFTPGTELILEGSYYLLKSRSGTELKDPEGGILLASHAEPRKDEVNIRAMLRTRIGNRMGIEAGFQQRYQRMQDSRYTSFSYTDRITAGTMLATYTGERFQAQGGLRMEQSRTAYTDVTDLRRLYLLPQISLKYNVNEKSNVKISFEKKTTRPSIHQLNPHPMTPDIYTVQLGNPKLVPEVSREASALYSLSFRENFLSAGFFYSMEQNIIESLTTLAGPASFHMEKQNLGDICHAGVRALGSINLHERVSVQSHLEISQVQTRACKRARQEGVSDRSSVEFRGMVSAVWAIRDDLSLSASLQRQGNTNGIHHRYHEGVLYFVNLEKEFFDRLNVGLTSAIPFMKSFTYQGYDVATDNFSVSAEDQIRMSTFPVWIKVKYSFASGKKVKRLERDSEFEETRIKKGF